MKEQVKEYYGKILQGSKDIKTNACCADSDSISLDVKRIIKQIEPEVLDKFYGCGSPIPAALEGCTVLDLGCGSGRDVYIASKLVGENGKVIGIDMTDEQLAVAKQNEEAQMKTFGYANSNVVFKQAYIEDLKAAGIEDNSVDVVISNCVINLSPEKESVFKEIFRVLKPGGELYFSDVFSDRRIPQSLAEDTVLHGECLGGAMYIEDFRRMLQSVGCADYREVSNGIITVDNKELEERLGLIKFYSITVRAFKLNSLEDLCEDYGQVATYKGTISGQTHYFDLDDHHQFEIGKPMLVCGNTAAMVQDTRFGEHFEVSGNRSVHYGAFDCDDSTNSTEDKNTSCC